MLRLAKVKFVFPSVMKSVTAGEKETKVDATTLREAVDRLVVRYGNAFKERVFDPAGNPRSLLNFYVNGKNARFLKQLETKLNEGDKVLILPTVSGG